MFYKNKTVFITGATRGIGKAIALKLASEGANVVVAAKSVEENPKLGGTIFTAAAEIENAGGKALAVQCDIRFEEQIQQVVEKAVSTFGGIDVLINNAGQLVNKNFEKITSSDLIGVYNTNVFAPYLLTQAVLTFLKKSTHQSGPIQK